MSEYDDFSMFELFRLEVGAQVEALTSGLLALEKSTSPETIEGLMRAAHSLKGAARIVGVSPAEKIAHALEDRFETIRDREDDVSSDQMTTLLQAVDFISLLGGLEDDDLAEVSKEVQNRLQVLLTSLGGRTDTSSLEVSQTPEVSPEPVEEPEPVLEEATEELQASHAELPPPSAKATTHIKTKTKKTVRLSTDHLDKLLGLAGETQVASNWFADQSQRAQQLRSSQAELRSKLKEFFASLPSSLLDEETQNKMQALEDLTTRCSEMVSDQNSALSSFDRRLLNLSVRLNAEVEASRMRPFSDLSQRFPRMARDLSQTLNKEISFEVQGEDTAVDRDILERLETPLVQLIRNAADHGIEEASERKRQGKPSKGSITVSAEHRAGLLRIVVQDDGRGIDYESLRKKVTQKGLVSKSIAKRLSEEELHQFLFLPSFTSKEEATTISGRGVGLDLVRSQILSLGGQLHLEATPGQGLQMQVLLPLTLSVIHCLLAKIEGEPYAFPLSRIDTVSRFSSEEVGELNGRPYIKKDKLPLIWLNRVLELGDSSEFSGHLNAIILSQNRRRFGMIADEFLGEQKLVVHRLDARLGKVPNVSAASILNDGQPVLILDVDDLACNAERFLESGEKSGLTQSRKATQNASEGAQKRVLLVEDSITVREVERRILEQLGFLVDVAVDGADGWNQIREQSYDLVISDIDMPRMDGLEFVSLLKSDPKLRAIPVIIVSYKDREEDRRRGMEAGADFFLPKGSFHSESLSQAVRELTR